MYAYRKRCGPAILRSSLFIRTSSTVLLCLAVLLLLFNGSLTQPPVLSRPCRPVCVMVMHEAFGINLPAMVTHKVAMNSS